MSFANWLTYGQAEPPAPLKRFVAGPLEFDFDPANGALRNIRFHGTEVLRGIYAAVRDHNWDTIPAELSELEYETANDLVLVRFRASHRQGAIHFEWGGRIEAKGSSLHFSFNGEAKSTFRKNRIGFCILHPLEAAGAAARQTREDGKVIQGTLPRLIEPQIFGQATFRQMAALSHEFAPGSWANLAFEGDIFEMEDQRNWTDASFKTYCTPLALPFPIEISSGTRIEQRVSLHIRTAGPKSSGPGTASDESVQVDLSHLAKLHLPKIGLGLASHGAPLSGTEISRLRALRLHHLRADLRLSSNQWSSFLERPLSEATAIGSKVELAIHLPAAPGDSLASLAERLEPVVSSIARILILSEKEPATSRETFNHALAVLARLNLPLGAGSDCNFCELNREQALRRFPLRKPDFLFWSINPQVHAFDHLSMMETLQAQPETLHTARAFAGDKPLLISPITLKQRFNPVATGQQTAPDPSELPPQVDSRQLGLFTAAWTLGSIAGLANESAGSLTYYETTGARGLMETEAGSPWPDRFPSKPGMLFPVYHLFAALAGAEKIAIPKVSDPAKVAALALFAGEQLTTVILANLTPAPIAIETNTPFAPAAARLLDNSTVEQSLFEAPPLAHSSFLTRETFDLGPYAMLFLEFPAPSS